MHANHPVTALASKATRCVWMALLLGAVLGLSAGCATVEKRDSAAVFDGTALVGAHSVTITPSKTAGYPGEKVTARLTVKNIGEQPLWVPVPLSHCRLDLQFGPVDEIIIDDPFYVPQFTCRKLAPGAAISVEKTFVVPSTSARCEFYTGYSHLRAHTVSFTVLQQSNNAPAISAN